MYKGPYLIRSTVHTFSWNVHLVSYCYVITRNAIQVQYYILVITLDMLKIQLHAQLTLAVTNLAAAD